MTTYTIADDLQASTTSPEGVALTFTYQAGEIIPTTEIEARLLADLSNLGRVAVAVAAPAKQTKVKAATADEKE